MASVSFRLGPTRVLTFSNDPSKRLPSPQSVTAESVYYRPKLQMLVQKLDRFTDEYLSVLDNVAEQLAQRPGALVYEDLTLKKGSTTFIVAPDETIVDVTEWPKGSLIQAPTSYMDRKLAEVFQADVLVHMRRLMAGAEASGEAQLLESNLVFPDRTRRYRNRVTKGASGNFIMASEWREL